MFQVLTPGENTVIRGAGASLPTAARCGWERPASFIYSFICFGSCSPRWRRLRAIASSRIIFSSGRRGLRASLESGVRMAARDAPMAAPEHERGSVAVSGQQHRQRLGVLTALLIWTVIPVRRKPLPAVQAGGHVHELQRGSNCVHLRCLYMFFSCVFFFSLTNLLLLMS